MRDLTTVEKVRMMAKIDVNKRFDALLKAMSGPNAEKPQTTRRASREARDADCDETRTRQDTSKDAAD